MEDQFVTLERAPRQIDRTSRADELSAAFRANRSTMYAIARRFCGDDAASDVVQEAFLRVWRNESFDPAMAPIRNYLMMVTRGVAIDALRQRTTSQMRDERHGRNDTYARDEVDRGALMGEVRESVDEALACLRNDERAVIVAAYYDDLTHREIAVKLGIPEGTVKSRIRVAMIKLRFHLRQFAEVDDAAERTPPQRFQTRSALPQTMS